MSLPISVASEGYLTGSDIFPLPIATQGYINLISIPVAPEPNWLGMASGPVRKSTLIGVSREESEIMRIIQALSEVLL